MRNLHQEAIERVYKKQVAEGYIFLMRCMPTEAEIRTQEFTQAGYKVYIGDTAFDSKGNHVGGDLKTLLVKEPQPTFH
jgi:hypothetical protein